MAKEIEHIATVSATSGSFLQIASIPSTYRHLVGFFSYNHNGNFQMANNIDFSVGWADPSTSEARLRAFFISRNSHALTNLNRMDSQFFDPTIRNTAGSIFIPNYSISATKKTFFATHSMPGAYQNQDQYGYCDYQGTTGRTGVITSVTLSIGSTLTQGVFSIYGVK